jgi:hypothetical protein
MGARGAAALAVLLALSAGADAHDNFKHRECKKVGNTEMQGSADGPNVRSESSPSLSRNGSCTRFHSAAPLSDSSLASRRRRALRTARPA